MTPQKRRPPYLSNLSPIRAANNSSPSHELQTYKNNMKIFIEKVQKQFSTVTDQYQSQIKQLTKQNMSLKQRLSKYECPQKLINSPIKNRQNNEYNLKNSSPISNLFTTNSVNISDRKKRNEPNFQPNNNEGELENLSELFSPIKKKKGGLIDRKQSIGFQSLFMDGLPLKSSLGEVDSNLFMSNNFKSDEKRDPAYKFELEDNYENLGRSKFQRQGTKKKQRQQNLLNSLQMGQNNLDLNTTRMFSLLGKDKTTNPQALQQSPSKKQGFSLKKKVSTSDPLNTSLNSICDSLNNSFHAQKAQAKKHKKREKLKQGEQLKKIKQKQQDQMLKEQGIKNLLKSMRNNIKNSAEEKPIEVIRSSKLLMAGEGKTKNKSMSRSKVMINPVPVDLQKKTAARGLNESKVIFSNSPTKKPQSILKNSSANILGGTLANISAISFHESGGEQYE